MSSTQPRAVIIDHSTGNVSILGENQTSAKDKLASELMEQAQTVETAATGMPPLPDEEG